MEALIFVTVWALGTIIGTVLLPKDAGEQEYLMVIFWPFWTFFLLFGLIVCWPLSVGVWIRKKIGKPTLEKERAGQTEGG